MAGIAHYGNCIGIPTVGGEVYFDECYNGNPLVNALSLGVLRHDQIKRGKAAGIGNPVIYVGSATGRDGLAGAAFASRELTKESQEDRRRCRSAIRSWRNCCWKPAWKSCGRTVLWLAFKTWARRG